MKREKPVAKICRRSITQIRRIALIVEPEAENDLFCPACADGEAATIGMISPLLAAKLLGVSTREIYRNIEAGDSHFVEFDDRRIFVCLTALRKRNLKLNEAKWNL